MNAELSRTIPVWDPAVRLFHWTLAGAFLVAYVTEDEWEMLHVNAGYLIGILIALRLLWGFIGTPHARFADFVHAPSEVTAYVSDAVRLRAPRYIGHNPAGGAMVLALLISLTVTVLTGIALYDPMAPCVNPKRLTERRQAEKWFKRNCKRTLGRACTAQEKGDLLSFLRNQ